VLPQNERPQQLLLQLAAAQLPQLLKDKKITLKDVVTTTGAGVAIAVLPMELVTIPLPSATFNIKAEEKTFVFNKK
jgi:hypothetical protein